MRHENKCYWFLLGISLPLLLALSGCEASDCPEHEKLVTYACNSVHDDVVICEAVSTCPSYSDQMHKGLIAYADSHNNGE